MIKSKTIKLTHRNDAVKCQLVAGGSGWSCQVHPHANYTDSTIAEGATGHGETEAEAIRDFCSDAARKAAAYMQGR